MNITHDCIYDKNKYKEILFKTLKAFAKFCEENHLQYFGSGGTVLGAVRHQGLIPWDDDIDVYMPRKDYEQLLSLKKELKGSGYEICSIEDNDYYLPFAKFCDANTTIWELKEHPYILGIYIDIFPLDENDGNLDNAVKMRDEYGHLVANYNFSIKHFSAERLSFLWNEGMKKTALLFFIKFITCRLFGKQDRFKKEMIAYEEKIKQMKGDYLLYYYCTYGVKKELYKKEWFEGYVILPYEDFSIRVCKGYKEYLSQLFGDYMTPPPPEKRVSRHFMYYVDLDRRLSVEEIKMIKKTK